MAAAAKERLGIAFAGGVFDGRVEIRGDRGKCGKVAVVKFLRLLTCTADVGLQARDAHAVDDAEIYHLGAAAHLGSQDRKSTRLNSSHQIISYAVFCLKKKKKRADHTYIVLSR